MNIIYRITEEGYYRKQEELRLLRERHTSLLDEKMFHKDQEDLSENEGYQNAERDLSNLLSTIREMESYLGDVQVVEKKTKYSFVEFGCSVELLDITHNEELKCTNCWCNGS